MTTTAPSWLNLDVIHPPEEREKLPALIEAARGVLEAVASFNRAHVDTMHAYYKRSDDGPDDLHLVHDLTGMTDADGYLLLAGYIIEHTVVGQGTATDEYAVKLLAKHSDLVEGVQTLYIDDRSPLPKVQS